MQIGLSINNYQISIINAERSDAIIYETTVSASRYPNEVRGSGSVLCYLLSIQATELLENGRSTIRERRSRFFLHRENLRELKRTKKNKRKEKNFFNSDFKETYN